MRSKLRQIRGYPVLRNIVLKANPMFEEGFLAALFHKDQELNTFWRTRIEFGQDKDAADCLCTKAPAIFKASRNGDYMVSQFGVLLDGELVFLEQFKAPYVIQDADTFQVEVRIRKDLLPWDPDSLQPLDTARL